MTNMTTSVSVTDLSKAYGKSRALNRISFRIEAGSVYGLIGPNGAGKTTSLAILAGLIKPDSGEAWILGREVKAGRSELRSKVGFSSPQFPLFDYLTGIEMLSTFGLMHGLPLEQVRRRSSDLLELMDLQAAAGQYISHYSQGMRRKLGLACALIHAPDVLLLDEPFLGLDPASSLRLACALQTAAGRGQTVVLSSHNMAIVERLCNRAGILHKGVLKREIELEQKNTPHLSSRLSTEHTAGLEKAFWKIVGSPEMKIPDWI
jgi:ABC-2 type transport system ATP-binding protein